MPERLNQEDFTKHLGTKFRVRLDEVEGAPAVELELAEVVPYATLSHARGDAERFSVYFYGPGNVFLPQRTYRLGHEQLGELDIFLVPVAQDERGFRYEAVFSYFKDKG
ncbi:MAG TPA: hypothetical protein VM936_04175 [Pyrinomonadaceae bacterium]|jgi:hypothetical protein|nr:hypothetical protein [Pyrinomonadaceae bacterium]